MSISMSAATQPVLFLDAEWRPLRIDSWQDAIADFFLGKVEVVEYSRDRMIAGVGRTFPLPSVVRVVRRFKRDRIRIRFSRLNIYARDGFTCQYCAVRFPTEDLTFDHVLPRSCGGRTTWENIVTSCIRCNSAKGARTPEAAGMKLRRRPRRPTFLPPVTVRMGGAVPQEWRPYWSGELQP
jgi:5-methylcytosine-specific restriction endonuclease McrA